MMYLTYEEYQNMGGTLDQTTFNDLEFEARCKVDYWTFGRLKKEEVLPEELQRCMYRLIKLITEAQQASSIDGQGGESGSVAGIGSMSNDGVSISYNVLNAKDAVELASKEMDDCIRQYLADVKNSLGQKVLYRGLYPGE